MKKVIKMGVKPLAIATAFAAGTTASMIAVALPGGGDTLGATAVVNESICQQSVDMTISGSQRSITTGTGICQLRTLPPTKGLVLADSNPAGSTVSDSSALVNAGGELYEAYVGGNRQAAVLLTPNRALATSRYISYVESPSAGDVSFDMAATVQPSTGLQASWLTGTYRVQARVHDWRESAGGFEHSTYANPNYALGEYSYTKHYTIQFNGDNTCAIQDYASHHAFQLTKDPTDAFGQLEMDNGCTVGGGLCAQNDYTNYRALGVLNWGVDGLASAWVDWQDQYNTDGEGVTDGGCTYSVSGSEVTVHMNLNGGPVATVDAGDAIQWDESFQVSADLRYLVSNGGYVDSVGGMAVLAGHSGGLAVGVRVGGGDVAGKTYLVNELNSTYALSTPMTASYENPQDPLYQEEECASRGALTFNVDGSCSYNSRSTCSGRKKSGYEETSDGAGNGTVADSLAAFDGAPQTAPTCSWSGTASNLTVDLGVTRMDGATVNVHFIGSASDNGEGLVLDGTQTNAAPAADEDNPPALPTQQFNMLSFMVGQQYTGDLNADADADGVSNLGEFLWASNDTPQPTGSVRYDLDGDDDSDVLMRNSGTGQWTKFTVQGGAVTGNSFFNVFSSLAIAYQSHGDFDGDGDQDILVRNTGTGQWTMFPVTAGNAGAGVFFNLYASSDYTLQGVGDFDADGDDDVLMRSTSAGTWRLFTVQSGAVTGSSYFNMYTNSVFAFAGLADTNGDGTKDVILRNTSTGQWTRFPVTAGAAGAGQFFNMYATTDYTFQTAGDFDNDGDDDLVLRSSSTGQWRLFTTQAGAVTGNSFFALFASTSVAFAMVGDFNADGTMDVLLRNTSTGAFTRFNISAGAPTGNASFSLFSNLAMNIQK